MGSSSPATSSLCCLPGLGRSQLCAEGAEPGMAVGPGYVIGLVPEQTGHSGSQLQLEGLHGTQTPLGPWRFIAQAGA